MKKKNTSSCSERKDKIIWFFIYMRVYYLRVKDSEEGFAQVFVNFLRTDIFKAYADGFLFWDWVRFPIVSSAFGFTDCLPETFRPRAVLIGFSILSMYWFFYCLINLHNIQKSPGESDLTVLDVTIAESLLQLGIFMLYFTTF